MPQYKFLHSAIILMIFFSLFDIVFGLSLILFGVPLIGILCVISSLITIMYTRRSTSRRYIVDTRYFRTPRNIKLSTYFAYRIKYVDYVHIITVLICSFVCVVSFSDFNISLLFIILTSPAMICFYSSFKGLIKFHYDWSFRIVLFRRYANRGSAFHKRYVMPICGLFGQVLLFVDDTLSSAWEGFPDRRSQWVISEMYQPLIADREATSWKPVISEQLHFADLVVIDWSGDITPNMVWEFVETLRLIPPNRIIMLSGGNGRRKAQEIIGSLNLGKTTYDIIFCTAPEDALTNLLFIRKFIKTVSALRVSQRPPIDAGYFTMPEESVLRS